MGITRQVPARTFLALVFFLLVFIWPATAEETPGPGNSQKPTVILREEEVLEYEGERLSPIIIAYKMNDIILPSERGFPFQLVAENKFGYKWIKWIVRIELSDDLTHRGYWESRGYDNEAEHKVTLR